MIYSSSTPCSLWQFSVSVETPSDLHPCCLNSKYQCSIKQSARGLENEQPLVFYSRMCSKNTCRLLSFSNCFTKAGCLASVSFRARRSVEEKNGGKKQASSLVIYMHVLLVACWVNCLPVSRKVAKIKQCLGEVNTAWGAVGWGGK